MQQRDELLNELQKKLEHDHGYYMQIVNAQKLSDLLHSNNEPVIVNRASDVGRRDAIKMNLF